MRRIGIAALMLAGILTLASQAEALGGGGGRRGGGGSFAGAFTGGDLAGGSFAGSCEGNVCTGTITRADGSTYTGRFIITAEPFVALAVGLGLAGIRYLRRR